MAIMIPKKILNDNGSYGERLVFESLSKLPDDYIVYHSLLWNYKTEKKGLKWRESDFVVLHQKKGVLVIEVKGGRIEYKNNQWTSNGNELWRGPLEQAEESMFKYKKMIESKLPKNNECGFGAAVWFPQMDKKDFSDSLPMAYNDNIVLDEYALNHTEDFIKNAFYFCCGSEKNKAKLSNNAFDIIRGIFQRSFVIVPTMSSVFKEQEAEFIRLTEQQNLLLDYLKYQRVVTIQGAAGTGKTVLAVEKARRLAEELEENKKVLFLCYNRALMDHLNNTYGKIYENVDFYNLESLAKKKLKIPGKVDEADILNMLNDPDKYGWEYKHIIVDEGQDLSNKQIVALYNVAEFYEGDFYVFFDKNQFVQGSEYPEWLDKAECRLVLSFNLRNTKAIAETSCASINIKPEFLDDSVGESKEPIFQKCENKGEAMQFMSNKISEYRKAGISYDRMCILTLKGKDTPNKLLDDCKKIGVHPISEEREEGKILYTTVRKFKGLEADAIIVVDFGEATFEDYRKTFYVGTSRAKHFLDLLFVGDDDSFERMAKKINGKEIKKIKPYLRANLHVKYQSKIDGDK